MLKEKESSIDVLLNNAGVGWLAELRSIPLHRWGENPDIIGVALMLESRAGAFITGQIIPIDGGTTLV